MKKQVSLTPRTTEFLKNLGYFTARTEHWNPFAHIRQDLFHWIDLVAVHPQRQGVLGVQVSTHEHQSDRIKKALGNPALIAWLLAGNSLTFHGWQKLKNRWVLKERPVAMTDLIRSQDNALPDSILKES